MCWILCVIYGDGGFSSGSVCSLFYDLNEYYNFNTKLSLKNMIQTYPLPYFLHLLIYNI